MDKKKDEIHYCEICKKEIKSNLVIIETKRGATRYLHEECVKKW